MQARLPGSVAETVLSPLHTSLSEVPLQVQVVLGTRKMSLREISELSPGSIVQTDRPAGGAVELRVNSVRFGCGDVQVEGDRLSVQITELYAND